MTTHEEIALPGKKERKRKPNKVYYPYSHGLWNNLKDGMCAPNAKSLAATLDV